MNPLPTNQAGQGSSQDAEEPKAVGHEADNSSELEMMLRWMAQNSMGSEDAEYTLNALSNALDMLAEFYAPERLDQQLVRRTDLQPSDSDTKSGSSEAQSSRPMTLRQQLEEILKMPLLGADIQDWADAIERYSQEIASEARLDELTSFPVDKKFPEQLEYIVSRSSELTHQPPEAT